MDRIEQKNIRFDLDRSEHVKAYEMVQKFDKSKYHNLSNYIVACLNKLDEYEKVYKDGYVSKLEFQEKIDLMEKRLSDLEEKGKEAIRTVEYDYDEEENDFEFETQDTDLSEVIAYYLNELNINQE